MKKVLILNTSHNDLRLILALKEMGFYVVSIGNRPGLVGEKYVNQYIQMDYSCKEEVLALSRKLNIDAICACCNDIGVITAAYVAEEMGLPGHDSYENTLIMHHKDRFKKFARDTIMGYYERDCDYKILTYVDSIGCIRCHLSFSAWKPFIELLKDTCPSCNVLFFIHPMSRKNIEYLLTKEGFDYPVCIDEHDSINKLNHFPIETIFQTFLLDKNNRVVAIGNPIHNPKIKELYLNIITGKKSLLKEIDSRTLTTVVLSTYQFNIGTFNWGKKQFVEFSFTNSGDNPFVVEEIYTPCGCTSVEYSKEPVQPGGNLKVKVEYQAEHSGHFDKTITVYCNAEGSPFHLKISGNAK